MERTTNHYETSSPALRAVKDPLRPWNSPNITPRSGTRRARLDPSTPSPQTYLSNARVMRPDQPGEERSTPRTPVQGWSTKSTRPLTQAAHFHTEQQNSNYSPLSYRPHSPALSDLDSPGTRTAAPRFFYANERASLDEVRPSSACSGFMEPRYAAINSTRSDIDNAMSPTYHDKENTRPQFFRADEIVEAKSRGLDSKTSSPLIRPRLQTFKSEHSPSFTHAVRPRSPIRGETWAVSPKVIPVDIPQTPVHNSTANNTPRTTNKTQAMSKSSSSRSSSFSASAKPVFGMHQKSSSSTFLHQMEKTYPRVGGPAESKRSSMNAELRERWTTRGDHARTQSLDAEASQEMDMKQDKIDELNELAATARRNRKVLDLEISNSSLLAINRTLEREMRKQTAEIRRFQRLERLGRLSRHSMSHSHNGTPTRDDDSDTMSDFESDSDSDDSLDEGKTDGAALARPDSTNSPDESQEIPTTRFYDRPIPPLNLTPQRTNLHETRRLNQTIKHCLDRSEVLVKSGKEALQKTVADAEEDAMIGPRVLSPDEIEHDLDEQRHGLLSPGLADHGRVYIENPWEETFASRRDDFGAGRRMDDASLLMSENVLDHVRFDQGDDTSEDSEIGDTEQADAASLPVRMLPATADRDIRPCPSDFTFEGPDVADSDVQGIAQTVQEDVDMSSTQITTEPPNTTPTPPPSFLSPDDSALTTDAATSINDDNEANTPGNRSSLQKISSLFTHFGSSLGTIRPV